MSETDQVGQTFLASIEKLVDEKDWNKAQTFCEIVFAQWRNKTINFNVAHTIKFFNLWTAVLKQIPTPPPYPKSQRHSRLVLNIMQNFEYKIIARCLKSVLGVVDAIIVSNNYKPGEEPDPENNSLSIVRDTVPLNIPLSIESEPWKNFGHNRSLGLRHSQRAIQRWGWHLEDTYLLLIDCDMVLRVTPAFDKSSLGASDSYQLIQRNGNLDYYNTRLVRASQEWTYVQPTHEYLSGPPGHSSATLDTLYIDDLDDGANHKNKSERDERLLLDDLVENPKNARSMFYLAETYRHRGDPARNDLQQSIQYYRKHIETGSFEEEMWYSMYAIGICHERLGQWPLALDAYLKAWQRRPTRAEPLFRVAQHYRFGNNEQRLAMFFLEGLLTMPYPKDDLLFIERNIYDYGIANEVAICGWYTGQRTLAHNALEFVLRAKNVPEGIRQENYFNARFYVKPLAGKTASIQLKPQTLPAAYNPCNPSIIRAGADKLLVLCRGVNYNQKGARNYKVNVGANETKFRTQNVLMTFQETPGSASPGDGLVLVNEKPIISSIKGPYEDKCQVCGLEDGRLVSFNGNTYFSATSLEHNEGNSPMIVLVKLSDVNPVDLDGIEEKFVTVQSVVPLRGHNDNECQKNWLPFVKSTAPAGANKLQFIYGYNPVTIIECPDPATGVVSVVKPQAHFPKESKGYRGSAGPIQLPNQQGVLVLIHEVSDRAEGRHYMHRLLWFTDDTCLKLKACSDLFYFRYKDGVEMCLGMALSGDAKSVYFTIGIEDAEAYLETYTLRDVLNFIVNPVRSE